MRRASSVVALTVAAALTGCSQSDQPQSGSTLIPTVPVRTKGISGPDLIFTQVQVTSQTPTTISYSWTIQNIGDAPADLEGPTPDPTDNVSVQAFLSQDTIFNNAGDLPAGGTIVGLSPGVLNPGETMNGSFSSGVTADPCGFAYLVLMVDWGHVVAETNEDNNTLAAPIGCPPDLVITQVQVTAHTANSISYSWTIQNVGSAPAILEGPTPNPADNVSVQAFLSQDTIFNNAGDLPAGGTIVGVSPGVLLPGQTMNGSFSSNVTADPCTFAYLVLMVDWGQVVAETNENNNTLAAPINCCPEMVIDIKPGSYDNPVNPKSKGVIPVAILGSADLDVHDIDLSTVAFGPNGVHEIHKSLGHFEDVNNDGYLDLMLHFSTQGSGIHTGDTEACLTAALDDGCHLSDCDNITTVPPPELSGP